MVKLFILHMLILLLAQTFRYGIKIHHVFFLPDHPHACAIRRIPLHGHHVSGRCPGWFCYRAKIVGAMVKFIVEYYLIELSTRNV